VRLRLGVVPDVGDQTPESILPVFPSLLSPSGPLVETGDLLGQGADLGRPLFRAVLAMKMTIELGPIRLCNWFAPSLCSGGLSLFLPLSHLSSTLLIDETEKIIYNYRRIQEKTLSTVIYDTVSGSGLSRDLAEKGRIFADPAIFIRANRLILFFISVTYAWSASLTKHESFRQPVRECGWLLKMRAEAIKEVL
jgi:hypothetical protein